MSDEEVKTVEATETEAKTEEKKDTRSYRAKAVFAKKRVEEKKKEEEEKKKKSGPGWLARNAVKLATAATVGMSLAPNEAQAATPGDNDGNKVVWVNGQNPNESTIALEMPDGTVLDGSNGIGAQPVKDLPRYKLGGTRNQRTADFSQEQRRMASQAPRQATSYGEIVDNALAKYQRSNPNCELTYMEDLSRIVDTHPYSKYGGFCAVFAADNMQTGTTKYVFITQNPRRGPYKVLGEHEVETALQNGNGFFACGGYCTFGGRRYHVGGTTSVRVNAGSHGVNVGVHTSGRRGGAYGNVRVSSSGRVSVNGGFTIRH